MSNLAELKIKTFNIEFNGKQLNIKQPNKRFYLDLMQFKNAINEENEEKVIETAYSTLFKIINRNTNKIEIAQEELEEELSFSWVVKYIKEYENFSNEVIEEVNFY